MGTDSQIRAAVGGVPVPHLDTAMTAPAQLADARVAVVTTAGLRPAGDVRLWNATDGSYTVLPRDARDVQLSHFSPNFDRAGIAADLNVVYPLDRLDELERNGEIGSINDRHLSFMGAQTDLSTIIHDTGPAAAQLLIDDGVDIVLLTPV